MWAKRSKYSPVARYLKVSANYEGRSWTKCWTRRFVVALRRFVVSLWRFVVSAHRFSWSTRCFPRSTRRIASSTRRFTCSTPPFVVLSFRRFVMAFRRFDVSFHCFDSSTHRGYNSTWITWSITLFNSPNTWSIYSLMLDGYYIDLRHNIEFALHRVRSFSWMQKWEWMSRNASCGEENCGEENELQGRLSKFTGVVSA